MSLVIILTLIALISLIESFHSTLEKRQYLDARTLIDPALFNTSEKNKRKSCYIIYLTLQYVQLTLQPPHSMYSLVIYYSQIDKLHARILHMLITKITLKQGACSVGLCHVFKWSDVLSYDTPGRANNLSTATKTEYTMRD